MKLNRIKNFFTSAPGKKLLKFCQLGIIGLVVGLLLFLFLYGRYPLYFSHVNWLYQSGGDNLQHQLGWEWFRQEPWRFPIGRIDSYGYPFGTYLAYLDSIPLLAIPLKVLSPLLDQRFQYFGLWELMSVIGQVIAGMVIIGEFTSSYPKRILGASLLVLSPPMINRAFIHSSLSAHWILLFGIWLTIRAYKKKSWRFAWPLLFGLAILVHVYFVAMLIPFWLLSIYFQYRKSHKKWLSLIDLLSVITVILVLGFSIGIFSVNVNNLQNHDYGYFSWNMNGFFNPQGSSTFFDGLDYGVEGQYEGFSYLGLGYFFLFPIALLLFLEKETFKGRSDIIIAFAVVSILYIFIAASNKGYLNSIRLWDFNLPTSFTDLLSVFRASGRFIWPVFYILLLFILISVLRNLKHPEVVLLCAIVFQLVDIQPLYASKQLNRFVKYESPLQSEFWSAAENNEHIVLIPANDSAYNTYESIALYARQNQMTLNWGYFARSDNYAVEKYTQDILADLKAGNSNKDTLYIFHTSESKEFANSSLSTSLVLCDIDDLLIGFSLENPLLDTFTDSGANCSRP
ncbi:MAG: hypothetical protein H0S79_03065 [Anaerolineaceae bacterium]|nr:hypothetical protein [Anaerolineaceae bacterium]